MSYLQRLFVATDFSASAKHAVMRAAELTQTLNAELDIAHIIEPSLIESLKDLLKLNSEETEAKLLIEAQAELNALAKMVKESHGITAKAFLENGAVLPSLIALTERQQSDLVLLAAKGDSLIRHWALGSTAERLIRLLEKPMLVVKQSTQVHYHRVMVAADFSPWSVSAIHLAKQVAPHAHLVLAHVVDMPEESKLRMAGVDDATLYHYHSELTQKQHEKLTELATQAGLERQQWSPLVLKGNAAQRLLAAEASQSIDLIVLGKHGQGWFKEMLIGSTTKQLLSESRIDLLIAQRG